MISLIKNLKKDLKKKRLSIFAATTTLLANTSLCFAVENEIRSMNEIGHDALVHSLSFLGPRECTQAGEVNSFWHENSDLANQQRESVTIDCSANPRMSLGMPLLEGIFNKMPHIKSLSLTGCKISDEGAMYIANNFESLTALNLYANRIGDAGARAIASSSHMAQLTSLNLSWNEIGEAGAQAIAGSPNIKQLTSLNLSGNEIGDAGARAIAGSSHMAQLTSLNLSGNGTTPYRPDPVFW
jgi:Leucine-rich repeat (LRR) protein